VQNNKDKCGEMFDDDEVAATRCICQCPKVTDLIEEMELREQHLGQEFLHVADVVKHCDAVACAVSNPECLEMHSGEYAAEFQTSRCLCSCPEMAYAADQCHCDESDGCRLGLGYLYGCTHGPDAKPECTEGENSVANRLLAPAPTPLPTAPLPTPLPTPEGNASNASAEEDSTGSAPPRPQKQCKLGPVYDRAKAAYEELVRSSAGMVTLLLLGSHALESV